MKIVGRSAVILAAALVIVGIALGLAQTSYLQNSTPSRGDFEQRPLTTATSNSSLGSSSNPGQSSTSNVPSPEPPFKRDRSFGGRERGQSGNLFGIVSVIQSLAIISLIVALVIFIPRLWQGRQSRLSVEQ